jgi:hypothetical protein
VWFCLLEMSMAKYEEQSHGFTYDVSLSFRGADTRHNFIWELCVFQVVSWRTREDDRMYKKKQQTNCFPKFLPCWSIWCTTSNKELWTSDAHQNRFGKDSENIKAWTEALSEAADLKGHHIHTGYVTTLYNFLCLLGLCFKLTNVSCDIWPITKKKKCIIFLRYDIWHKFIWVHWNVIWISTIYL